MTWNVASGFSRPVTRLTIVTLGILASLTLDTRAQDQEFQFVSVRKAVSTTKTSGIGYLTTPGAPSPVKPVTVLPGGRFEARNQTLENLVRLAYGFERLNPHDTVKTPSFSPWITVDEFDVTATMDGEWTTPPPGETVPTELRGLLRMLLEDRFDLKARLETRPVHVYSLRLANQASSPGPGLRPAANTCLGPYTELAPGEPPRPSCTFRVSGDTVEAGSVTMKDVARIVAQIDALQLDHAVVDGTGIGGTYDLVLSLAGTGSPPISNSIFPLPPPTLTGSLSSLPTFPPPSRVPLNTRLAIEQQLGLTLSKAKQPLPTLVIEDAKKPRED